MLMIVNVEDRPPQNLKEKALSIIRPFEIRTEIKSQENLQIMNIRYIRKRGEIRFRKIYELCSGRMKTVLCSKNISLEHTYLIRFSDIDYKKIILGNYICYLIEKSNISSSDLKIGFYDPYGENSLLLQRLLKYTSNILVVSDMLRFYENEAERISKETGASVIVSNDISDLSKYSFLAAPCIIEKSINIGTDGIIFTAAPPLCNVSGTVITDYHTLIPKEFSMLKPDDIDETYFLAALFSLCSVSSLSEIVPVSCGNENEVFTSECCIRRLRSLLT